MVDQQIIDYVVEAATEAALTGAPIERMIWFPLITGVSDPLGSFIVHYKPPVTGSNPW